MVRPAGEKFNVQAGLAGQGQLLTTGRCPLLPLRGGLVYASRRNRIAYRFHPVDTPEATGVSTSRWTPFLKVIRWPGRWLAGESPGRVVCRLGCAEVCVQAQRPRPA